MTEKKNAAKAEKEAKAGGAKDAGTQCLLRESNCVCVVGGAAKKEKAE
jgi:hypothetical protein